ncbi:MAG: GTP-binding protein [Candidatus Heimdallarchaeota archaeon]|nr:GTP-binding protein [Candidatus Heimdallarchaeota archaeon]
MSKYIENISVSMKDKVNIRNVSIISHVDHGKTTLSDHLLQAGGLISPSMAGSARVLDYLDEEQKRGITIKTANISLLYTHDNISHLINLVDTPGHVDFSGMVSQALRLVDGVIVVVDVVEQIMAQTESVIRQAMKECLRPILFINKIDRLINELKLPKEDIEVRIGNIIQMVNELINQYAHPPFKKDWQVRFDNGTVVIGSALHAWAISVYSKRPPLFDEIIKLHAENNLKRLRTDFPVTESMLSSIIDNVPNPKDAQKYRIKYITQFIDQKAEQALVNCEDNGSSILCLGKLLHEDNRGLISVVRIFSGTVKSGDILLNGRTGESSRIQQVCIYKGQSLMKMDAVGAGNIAALIGMKNVQIGDTLIEKAEHHQNVLFEQILYLQESVISRRIEPAKVSDIPKLLKVLDILALIKPNFHHSTDENTGEMKIFGIGELQLEIILGEIEQNNIKVNVSDPEVTLVEQIERKVELVKKDQLDLLEITLTCEPTDQNEKVCVYSDHRENCLLVEDKNWGEEINDLFEIGFRNAILKGPMKGFFVRKLTMVVKEIKELSPNSIRYEIIVPLVRNTIHEALIEGNIGIYEPIYSFSINTPIHYMGAILAVIQRSGCEISNTEHHVLRTIIHGEISVESSLQIALELRAASEGYAFWQFKFQGYKKRKN